MTRPIPDQVPRDPDEEASAKQPGSTVVESIDDEAQRLRIEIDRLRAALRDEANGRRRHKRIPGNGAVALLATPGRLPTSVLIHDLARGGAAVNCDWTLPGGADVTVVLPGTLDVVTGHVVRSDGAVLAVMFQQDADSLAQLDRALAGFGEVRQGGAIPTGPAPTAGGAESNEMDAAVDAGSGSGIIGTATTSGILTDSMTLPFAVVRDGRLAFANPAFMLLFRADKDLGGMALSDLIAVENRAAIVLQLRGPTDTLATFTGRAIRLDGLLFDVELLLGRETLNGVSTTCVFAKDVTRHRFAEKHLSYLAYTDVLTGLPNRALLMDRLRDAVVAARTETSCLAVLMADLDGFKIINDTFGHQAGDIVLQVTARRFLTCVRETDTLARLGGDEFCVLLPTIKHVRDAEIIATRFVEATGQAISIDGRDLRVGVSVGLALFPDHGLTVDAMLAASDGALYEAKKDGRSRYVVASARSSFKTFALPLITWDAAHDVGVAMIDKQHRQLAAYVNELAASLRRGDERAAISDKLATVLSCTRHHFESEERLMHGHGFTDAPAHRKIHAQLLDDFQAFSAGWDMRSLSLTARFLQEWLLHHIETADHDLARVLISRGVH